MKISFCQFRVFLFLVLVFVGFSGIGRAQDDATDDTVQPNQTVVPTDPSLRNAYFNRLCSDGSYDLVHEQTDTLIDKAESADPPQTADPMLYYWRGRAEYSIGWFGGAQTDLDKALKGGAKIEGATPQSLLAKIAAIIPLIPPQVTEVQSGGDVVFRVYYNQDDPLTRLILQNLPVAYQVNAAMYGADVIEQPVFIFNTTEQLQTFLTARGSKPASWAWAYGGRDAFYFCLETPQHDPVSQFRLGYLIGTVVHEHNHCLFSRAMGNVKVPNWFIEGIAMYAAGLVSKDDVQLNDYNMARVMQANVFIEPQRLEDSSAFRNGTELGATLDRGGAGLIAPSPYDEGYSMTRYLIANMQDGQLIEFLNKIRETKSFDQALQDEFGLTLNEFYEKWVAKLRG